MMTKTEKVRIVKMVVGACVFLGASFQSQKLIKEKVKKQPTRDIAVQLSNAFWSICDILYQYYYVGVGKEEG